MKPCSRALLFCEECMSPAVTGGVVHWLGIVEYPSASQRIAPASKT